LAAEAFSVGIGALDRVTARSTLVFGTSRVALALTAALLYYAGALLGMASRFPESAVSAIWPPNAILLALLLLVPRNRWWIILAAAIPAHIAALWDAGFTWWRLPWQLTHNFALVVSVGLGLCALNRERSPFGALRDLLGYVLVAVVVGPALIAWVAPTTVLALLTPERESALSAWRQTALSNAVALLTLTPALYLSLLHGRDWLRRSTGPRMLEAAAIGLATLAAHRAATTARVEHHAPLYLFMIPMVWAAMRFGIGGAATAISCAAIVWTLTGVVPHSVLIQDASQAGALDLQIFLIAISLTTLILATLSEERARSARELHKSESRYRTIVETQTDLVCRHLSDTTLTFVNHAYCRFFGKSREQLIGTKWIELLPVGPRDEVQAAFARLSPSSPRLIREHEVLLPDGSVGWQHWVNTCTFDSEGRLVEVQGIGRDFTELKRTERSLRESDERFQLVLRATSDVIFDWDIVRGTFWSSAEGPWALPSSAAPAWSLDKWAQGLHPDDRERYLSGLDSVLRSKSQTWETEYRYARDGGPMKHVHERAYILRNAEGAALRMIGSLADVSDRKRLDEVKQSLTKMSRLATVGEISASIAHEINQPLAAMLTNAEAGLVLLDSGRGKPLEIQLILEDIRNDSHRARDVVRKLGGLLRGHQSALEIIELDRVVRSAAELMRPEFQRRRAMLDVQCASRLRVRGDSAHLQEVILILLLNSLDALTDSAGSQRYVLAWTRRVDDQRVHVGVTDTGCGIAAERLSTIFDSFVTTKPEGMGVGLAIARSIVNAHGGRIWAANEMSGGATVAFELAVAEADASESPRTPSEVIPFEAG
jgi:PAS domain S-box-containing protein